MRVRRAISRIFIQLRGRPDPPADYGELAADGDDGWKVGGRREEAGKNRRSAAEHPANRAEESVPSTLSPDFGFSSVNCFISFYP